MKVTGLNAGDVLVKGNHERLFGGLDGTMVAYQTKTDIRRKMVMIVRVDIFEEWLDGAQLKSGMTL